MTSLAVLDRRPEQMDDPALDPAVYDRVLGDLSRINRWTLSARPTLAFLRWATAGMTRFRLLDVGFGHGDMLRAIARWSRRRGLEADLVGVDLNPKSLASAETATPPDLGIRYFTGDYREMAGPFDLIVSNFVAHHMSDSELDDFIRFMEAQAARGWLINDLHRHRFAHAGFPLLARLLGVHRIVREDGTLSIARSFRKREWEAVLHRAGAEGAQIVRRFPFRLCVERLR